jgi:hypothetical protein
MRRGYQAPQSSSLVEPAGAVSGDGMSIQSIVATFECDACGKSFRVVLDPATEINGASIADAADNELKGYFDLSIQQEMHLCGTCTRKADALGPEDYEPTREQILEACQADEAA